MIFARLGVEKPNVLLLDEPTNHLDLEAIEALVKGLRAYDGTLILVSHDRWFVSQLADRIVEISPTGINDFRGSYEEYVERCGDDHLDAENAVLKARREKRKAKGQQRNSGGERQTKRRRNKLRKRRDALTDKIEAAEARIHSINDMFCNPGFFDKTPEPEVRKLEREQKNLSGKVDEMMAQWEEVEQELGELH